MLVSREPLNIMTLLTPKAEDTEYHPPVDLFLYNINEQKEEPTPVLKKDMIWKGGNANNVERIQLGSYYYPMNISNIDTLKGYIESNGCDSLDDMPIDVPKLIKNNTIEYIDMNTIDGQRKCRECINQRIIFTL
jgi:hypothetical protein